MGAIALSSRPSLQPPPVTIQVRTASRHWWARGGQSVHIEAATHNVCVACLHVVYSLVTDAPSQEPWEFSTGVSTHVVCGRLSARVSPFLPARSHLFQPPPADRWSERFPCPPRAWKKTSCNTHHFSPDALIVGQRDDTSKAHRQSDSTQLLAQCARQYTQWHTLARVLERRTLVCRGGADMSRSASGCWCTRMTFQFKALPK